MQKEVIKLVERLLSLIGIDGKVEATLEEEKGEEGIQKTLNISVDAQEEAGLLIGSRGATLHSIQSFLAMALKQKTGEWVRIVLDVGDWRQKHEDYLEGLAVQAAERVRVTGEPQYLYNLTPSQRRVIHMALGKEEGISTESEGEGDERYLVVRPL